MNKRALRHDGLKIQKKVLCDRFRLTPRFKWLAARTIERIIGLLVLGSCTACSMSTRPFEDETYGQSRVTTPSVDTLLAETAEQSAAVRPFEKVERPVADGTVTHLPLYFEDPYEEADDLDGRIAWTGRDYWQIVYWRGRFLVNAVLFPISAIIHPPWRETASDGRLAKRCFGEWHDAEHHRSSD